MITLIVQKTKSNTLRPGRIFDHEVTNADFTYSEGALTFDVIVVRGNSQYPNGKHLRLFLKANGASLAAPVNTAVPTISGTQTEGQTLTATTGTWTGDPTPTYAYQWQRSNNGTTGWANIAGATASTRVLATADATKYLRVQVTATNSVSAVTASSGATGAIVGL